MTWATLYKYKNFKIIQQVFCIFFRICKGFNLQSYPIKIGAESCLVFSC